MAAPLPPGWEAAFDAKYRRPYYFNRKTKERSWDHPAPAPELSGHTASGQEEVQQRAPAAIRPDGAVLAPGHGSAEEATVAAGSWDADDFLRRLMEARSTRVKHQIKRILVEVAESNYNMRLAWRVPRTIAVSIHRCEAHRVRGVGRPPEISFSDMSTADALLYFAQFRQKPCALNFANGEHVGGGYKSGAMAQEEDLCRRIPNLYTSLFNAKRDGLYPFGPCTCFNPDVPMKYSDVLYTRGLTLARGGESSGFRLLPPSEQVTVSLVTAAAPNLGFAKEVNDLNLMNKTVKSIFIAPALEDPEVKVLILGAWGCGAFGGNPAEISHLFLRAIRDERLQLYEHVHFAIPHFDPSDRNASVFRDIFGKSGIPFRDISASAVLMPK